MVIYGLHVVYIWHTYGLHMVYLWPLYGLYMAYMWLIYGLRMAYIWLVCSPYMACTWLTDGLYMAYVWLMCGLYLVYMWHHTMELIDMLFRLARLKKSTFQDIVLIFCNFTAWGKRRQIRIGAGEKSCFGRTCSGTCACKHVMELHISKTINI